MMDLDGALYSIGDHGKGQMSILFLICFMGQLPSSWHIFSIAFLGATPNYACASSFDELTEDQLQYEYSNRTPGSMEKHEYSKCRHIGPTNDSTACDDWIYANEPYGSTIVSEWNLVCDRASFVELSQTVLMIGVTIGSVIFGYIVDRFGRRQIFFASLFMQGIFGCIEAFSPSFVIFLVFRLFIGITDQGFVLPAWAMVSELFTPRCRPYTFPCLFIFWAVGVMTLPILAYFIRNWRFLQLALSLPLLFCPLLCWFVPESPRWLLSVGRKQEATTILQNIARVNGRKDVTICLSTNKDKLIAKNETENNLQIVQNSSNGTEGKNNSYENDTTEEDTLHDEYKTKVTQTNGNRASYLDLFAGVHIAMVTIVIFIIWLFASMTFYGLTLNASHLVGNPYLNFFLVGLVEIPSDLTVMITVARFGRRRPISICFALAGIACIATAFIPRETESGINLTSAVVATAMLGKFAITVSFHTTCLCVTEVFPTVLRSKGIAFVAIAVRLGATIAPFIILMENRFPKLPMVLFGVVALVPSLLIFLLPEMKDRPQPQTMEDFNDLFRSKQKWLHVPLSDDHQGRKKTSV
ncbi:organic cation transporter-like protein [Apostichopus japonicus]|uniref:organic cation transporter-like protein n=1 Tax=Stichopus japonicus TaxID=307972 RepID=UPI003AB1A5B8